MLQNKSKICFIFLFVFLIGTVSAQSTEPLVDTFEDGTVLNPADVVENYNGDSTWSVENERLVLTTTSSGAHAKIGWQTEHADTTTEVYKTYLFTNSSAADLSTGTTIKFGFNSDSYNAPSYGALLEENGGSLYAGGINGGTTTDVTSWLDNGIILQTTFDTSTLEVYYTISEIGTSNSISSMDAGLTGEQYTNYIFTSVEGDINNELQYPNVTYGNFVNTQTEITNSTAIVDEAATPDNYRIESLISNIDISGNQPTNGDIVNVSVQDSNGNYILYNESMEYSSTLNNFNFTSGFHPTTKVNQTLSYTVNSYNNDDGSTDTETGTFNIDNTLDILYYSIPTDFNGSTFEPNQTYEPFATEYDEYHTGVQVDEMNLSFYGKDADGGSNYELIQQDNVELPTDQTNLRLLGEFNTSKIPDESLSNDYDYKLKTVFEYYNSSTGEVVYRNETVTVHQTTDLFDNTFYNTFVEAIEAVLSPLINTTNNLIDGVQSILNDLIDVFKSLISELIQTIIDVWLTIFTAGINVISYLFGITATFLDYLITVPLNYHLDLVLVNLETNQTIDLDNTTNASLTNAVTEGYTLESNRTIVEHIDEQNKTYFSAITSLEPNPVFEYVYTSELFGKDEQVKSTYNEDFDNSTIRNGWWVSEVGMAYSPEFASSSNTYTPRQTGTSNDEPDYETENNQTFLEIDGDVAHDEPPYSSERHIYFRELNYKSSNVNEDKGNAIPNMTIFNSSTIREGVNSTIKFNLKEALLGASGTGTIGIYSVDEDSYLNKKMMVWNRTVGYALNCGDGYIYPDNWISRIDVTRINDSYVEAYIWNTNGETDYSCSVDKANIIRKLPSGKQIGFFITSPTNADDEGFELYNYSWTTYEEQRPRAAVNWYSNPFTFPNGVPIGTITLISLLSGIIAYVFDLLPSAFGESMTEFVGNINSLVTTASETLNSILQLFNLIFIRGFEVLKLLVILFAGFKGLHYFEIATKALDENHSMGLGEGFHKITTDMMNEVQRVHDVTYSTMTFLTSMVDTFTHLMRTIRDYIKFW